MNEISQIEVENRDLILAKETFRGGDYSVVIVADEEVLYTDKNSRLLPLVKGLTSLQARAANATVADKVIGRAAAMCLVYFCISQVYTGILSEGAAEVLKHAGIPYQADLLVPEILNTSGDAVCKMEQMVADLDDPFIGAERLINFFQEIGKLAREA